MSLTNERLLILPFDGAEVFSSTGAWLAEELGASALLYAAVAYFSFDDEFPAQQMMDNHAELHKQILWWLEDIYTSVAYLFQMVRDYHAGNVLNEVVYDPDSEALYTTSRRDPATLTSYCGFARGRLRR